MKESPYSPSQVQETVAVTEGLVRPGGGDKKEKKQGMHPGLRHVKVGCFMKIPLRLVCLSFAVAGGIFVFPGEGAAATRGGKRGASSRHAVSTGGKSTKGSAVDPVVIREAQNALTELGFYFGEVDGELNEETRGALRRFQNYKGLGKSGEINEPTLAALRRASEENATTSRQGNRALSAAVRPAATSPPAAGPERPSVPPLEKLENPLGPPAPRSSHASSAAVRPSESPASLPPPRQETPVRPEEGPYYPFVRGTPYAKMPLSAQEEMMRNAQAALARKRFYRGEIDGAPTAATEEALYRFQSAQGLSMTGQLDQPTLRALGLIPAHRGASASMAPVARRPAAAPPQAYSPLVPSEIPVQSRTLGPAGKMIVPRGRRQERQQEQRVEPVYRGRTLYRGGVVRGIPLDR